MQQNDEYEDEMQRQMEEEHDDEYNHRSVSIHESEDDDSGIVEFCTYNRLIEKFGEEVAKNIIDLDENGEFWIDENGELIIVEI